MKKILVSLFIVLSHAQAFAQHDHNEIIERFLEQRKNMMEEIMKAFDDDDFFKSDFFNDENLFDSFKFKGFQGGGENVKIEEVMEQNGTISIYITPLNKNQKLDIKTTDTQIKITGETLVDEKTEGAKGSNRSVFKSSFARSIAIPEGYSAKSPVKEGERLKIALVPSKVNPLKPNKEGRIPVPKPKGEKTI